MRIGIHIDRYLPKGELHRKKDITPRKRTRPPDNPKSRSVVTVMESFLLLLKRNKTKHNTQPSSFQPIFSLLNFTLES